MTWLPFALLCGVLWAAVVYDVTARRIPNRLVLAGLGLALVWQVVGPEGNWTFDPDRPGATGVLGAILAAAAMLLGFIPLYALRIMGAGDVKLLAVVGAFFGASSQAWGQLPGLAVSVLAAGGVLAVGRMLFSGSFTRVIANLRLIFQAQAARLVGVPAPSFDPRVDSADRMPYALAIGAGVLFYVVGKWSGWLRIL